MFGVVAQGPGGEETDNKITVLTALTRTARGTNTIWFAAQDAPTPRYQPDTNHPVSPLTGHGSQSVLKAAKSECSSVESFADFCRSPCILPAAEKTRSTPADEAGAAKY